MGLEGIVAKRRDRPCSPDWIKVKNPVAPAAARLIEGCRDCGSLGALLEEWMRRREFIAGLGGAAAWPVVARSQQPERIRRVGVLTPLGTDEPEEQSSLPVLLQSLKQLGWVDGHNLRIDYRSTGGSLENSRKYAAELVALAPDVILAIGSVNMPALLQATRTVPIVFLRVPDPVGGGFVDSLAHPGGNATGFTSFEYGMSAKWLELLKEIAPGLKRAGVLRDPTLAVGTGQFGAIQAMAPSLGIEVTPINVREASEIERDVSAFARLGSGGLIVTAGYLSRTNRGPIIAQAARHRLPAVYYNRYFVSAGGLCSYGIDYADQYLRAAGYIDRILKGEKPADLPVQQASKFDLVINLKTAKAIGLEISPQLLARADEVIE
jgi:putative ABC transport system substrate-binding protein